MKTKSPTLLFVFLLAATISLQAQTPLPYFSGFDTPLQQAGWTLFRKAGTTSSDWQVSVQNAYSGPNSLVHAYPVSILTDDWYVSPPFYFAAGGRIDSLRFSFTGFSTAPSVNDTIAIYLLSGAIDPDQATKTLLLDFRGQNYVNDGVWRDTNNIFIPATTGNTTYIALRYKGNSSWLDVRFDNLCVSGIVPASSFSLSSTTPCEREFVSFSDLSTANPSAWNWIFSGATPSVSNIQNPTVSYTLSGTYTVSLMSSNSSGPGSIYTRTLEVNTCTGIKQQQELLQDVLVFPNPTKDKITLRSLHSQTLAFGVYTSSGHRITESELQPGNEKFLDLEPYATGIYFIHVYSADGTAVIKLLKE